MIDPVYGNLDAEDIDFIDTNLKVFTEDTASKCGQCKNRIRYARSLIEQYPEKSHLVTLLLFKHCLVTNNGTEK